MDLIFTNYKIRDEDGVLLVFQGDLGDYSIMISNAEIAAITNLAQFKALVETKLDRRINGAGIASRLDVLIGRIVTI